MVQIGFGDLNLKLKETKVLWLSVFNIDISSKNKYQRNITKISYKVGDLYCGHLTLQKTDRVFYIMNRNYFDTTYSILVSVFESRFLYYMHINYNIAIYLSYTCYYSIII